MNTYNIGIIKGDGVGPEVINEAIKVLDAISLNENFKLKYQEFLMGGNAYEITGEPLPQETINGIKKCDSVLFGAIGDPKYDSLPRDKKPETGLLNLRTQMEIFANLRPILVYDELLDASSLKANIIKDVDILIVRELTGGIYFGKPRAKEKDKAFNTMVYTKDEIVRIAKVAFEMAMKRKKKLCSVDKANVLEVSEFWRQTVIELSKDYPQVELSHMYVDNTAMQLVKDPKQFDVILTGNIFGDILSDEASILTGSIGLLPSASIGKDYSLYEPIHGSAPDIAKQGIVNPIATIASAAMMLEYSLNEKNAANKIRQAIKQTLKDGYRTKDISKFGAKKICSTKELGSIIAKNLSKCKI